jgi:hypothetical protein
MMTEDPTRKLLTWDTLFPELPPYDIWTETLGVRIREQSFVENFRRVEEGPWTLLACIRTWALQ